MNPQEIYTKKAKLYEKLFIEIFPYPKGVATFFKEYFSLSNKQTTILDAGTGTGTLIKELYSVLPEKEFEKINFTAFDISETMLTGLQRWTNDKKLKNIKLYESDVLKIDKQERDNSYDLIMSAGMLEYLPKSEFITAVSLLKKKLQKEGKLLLFISKNSLLNFFLIKLWWKANLFSRDELNKSLKQTKFQKVTFYKFPKEYNYLNWWGYIIEAEV